MERRTFLAGVGLVSGGGLLRSAPPSSLLEPAFAYVGSLDRITVLRAGGPRWQTVQTVRSRRPVSLVLHPNKTILFAANEVDQHAGLATGSVEAYAIHPMTGHLQLLNQQPLSLSAVRPRNLVLSPDGQTLVVAVYGGGAYNVLPVSASGRLGRVTQIFKEIGSGPLDEVQTTAHPHSVAFTNDGRHLFSTDLGSDRVNSFAIANGILHRSTRLSVAPGSGPSHMAIGSSGSLLFVQSALASALTVYRFHRQSAYLQLLTTLEEPNGRALALHPDESTLYSATTKGISAWHIDAIAGSLTRRSAIPLQNIATLTIAPDGRSLYATVGLPQPALLRLPIDAGHNLASPPIAVATLDAPLSLALLHA